MGLIEKIGYERYMLSKQYYSDTKQEWKYTKDKGLSKNKELILQHLQDFGEGTINIFITSRQHLVYIIG